MAKKLSDRLWKRRSEPIEVYNLHDMPIKDVIALLEKKAEGLKNPVLEQEWDYDSLEMHVAGYIRKTKEEIKAFDEHSKRAKKAAEKRKLAAAKRNASKEEKQKIQDMEDIERLKEKYPDNFK